MKYITMVDDREFIVEILDDNRVSVNGTEYKVDFESVSGQPVYSLLVEGDSFEAYVNPSNGDWQVLLLGQLYNVRVEDEREKRLRAASGTQNVQHGEFSMKAPMPGLVLDVLVAEGAEVEKGDVLIILESMKMQNELRSPRSGSISRVYVFAGDSVEQKQAMLVIE